MTAKERRFWAATAALFGVVAGVFSLAQAKHGSLFWTAVAAWVCVLCFALLCGLGAQAHKENR